MADIDLGAIIAKKRILVCCGSGGVGKTTISAALGVQAALAGKTVLALTIDPAKRLANSLGLKEIGNTEALVPKEKFLKLGLSPKGELYAMMLDTKHTFDELIVRYAPSETIQDNILNNRFYQNLSSAMAGVHEYLAMEKLYQLYIQGQYDLIVLDTPPTRHALDFLEAPARVRTFFDRNITRWFLKPYLTMGRLSFQVFNRSAATVFKMVERVTGAEFLRDVSEFMTGLGDSFDIFRSRAEEVMRVLQGASTAFLLVTGPERTALEEAAYFYSRLQEGRLPFGGIIVNRVHSPPLGDDSASLPSPDATSPAESGAEDPLFRHLQHYRNLPENVVGRLIENFDRYQRLAEQDRTILADFTNRFSQTVPVKTVPIFDEDIFDLDGLLKVNAHLFTNGTT